jgi:DDE superfamily endonuclease
LIILLVEGRTSTTKGCLVISVHDPVRGAAFGELRRFRRDLYGCLTSRADALFELTDAVLCADGPVRSLAELSLVGEHRRGHGSAYAAVADGRVDVERLRTALAAVALPRAADGRLVLAVDITCWLRPEAHTSPERILCHTYGRGKDQHIMIPGLAVFGGGRVRTWPQLVDRPVGRATAGSGRRRRHGHRQSAAPTDAAAGCRRAVAPG